MPYDFLQVFYDLTAVIFCWRVWKVVGVDLDGKKKHDKSQKDALRLIKKKDQKGLNFISKVMMNVLHWVVFLLLFPLGYM